MSGHIRNEAPDVYDAGYKAGYEAGYQQGADDEYAANREAEA